MICKRKSIHILRTLAVLSVLMVGGVLACKREVVDRPRPKSPRKGTPAPDSAVVWLRANTVPFLTSDPQQKGDDLDALTALLGQAQVVGLGEATHGTREIFQMKQRLIQELVTRERFRTFLMEADAATSCKVDEFIQGGPGDPRQLLRDLRFWTWNNQEFLDLLLWMRSYNQGVTKGEALHFFGMDMQDPLLARKVVKSLRVIDSNLAARAESAYSCLEPQEDRLAMELNYRQLDVSTQIRCTAEVASVVSKLESHFASAARPKGPNDICALWNVRSVVQAEKLLRFPILRDQLFAETVLTVLKESDKKVLVWAHNGHVANQKGAMGRSVKRELGERYAIVGMTVYGGEFRARLRVPDGSASRAVPVAADPLPDSYENALHRVDEPRFFLDLRRLRDSKQAAPPWLRGPHPMLDVGGVYEPDLAWTLVSLSEAYDALIFFDEGTPSTYFGLH